MEALRASHVSWNDHRFWGLCCSLVGPASNKGATWLRASRPWSASQESATRESLCWLLRTQTSRAAPGTRSPAECLRWSQRASDEGLQRGPRIWCVSPLGIADLPPSCQDFVNAPASAQATLHGSPTPWDTCAGKSASAGVLFDARCMSRVWTMPRLRLFRRLLVLGLGSRLALQRPGWCLD